jgi:hypothetical protein
MSPCIRAGEAAHLCRLWQDYSGWPGARHYPRRVLPQTLLRPEASAKKRPRRLATPTKSEAGRLTESSLALGRAATALLHGCHRRAKILGERHQMAEDQIPFRPRRHRCVLGLRCPHPVCRLRSLEGGTRRGRRDPRPETRGHGHRPSTEARRRAVGGDEDRGASARILTSRRRGPRSDRPPPLPGSLTVITPLQGRRHAVYQVALSAIPSRVWRAAFVVSCASRPPAILTSRD